MPKVRPKTLGSELTNAQLQQLGLGFSFLTCAPGEKVEGEAGARLWRAHRDWLIQKWVKDGPAAPGISMPMGPGSRPAGFWRYEVTEILGVWKFGEQHASRPTWEQQYRYLARHHKLLPGETAAYRRLKREREQPAARILEKPKRAADPMPEPAAGGRIQ
jgi:hypothetical protein